MVCKELERGCQFVLWFSKASFELLFIVTTWNNKFIVKIDFHSNQYKQIEWLAIPAVIVNSSLFSLIIVFDAIVIWKIDINIYF